MNGMRKGSPFGWSGDIITSHSILMIEAYVSPKMQQPTHTLNSKQKQKRQKRTNKKHTLKNKQQKKQPYNNPTSKKHPIWKRLCVWIGCRRKLFPSIFLAGSPFAL